ncbi:melanocyte-stimulating hormone receptor-like [Oculina patagonica]
MWNYSSETGTKSTAMNGSQMFKNSSMPETIVIINCVINAPLMLTSIIGNTLVLAAILRTPSLRSPSIMFLSSLAVSDLLVGFFVQPLYIASGLTRIHHLDNLWFMVSFATCGISLCSITAISVDRFLALHYHMRYPTLVTRSRAIWTLVIMWILIFLLAGIYYLDRNVYFLVIALGVGLCLLISIVAYIGIYRIVRHQQLQIHTQQQAVQAATEEVSSLKQLKRSALNSFVFFIVMVLFYAPMSVAMSLYLITKDWEQAWSFATTAVFMNSAINPLLYCWRLGKLRKAVVKTVKKMLSKQP